MSLHAKIRARVDEHTEHDSATPLADALLAVLDLHRQGEAQVHFGDRRPCCRECFDGRSRPVWPCPTVTLMASAMRIPSGGSDA